MAKLWLKEIILISMISKMDILDAPCISGSRKTHLTVSSKRKGTLVTLAVPIVDFKPAKCRRKWLPITNSVQQVSTILHIIPQSYPNVAEKLIFDSSQKIKQMYILYCDGSMMIWTLKVVNSKISCTSEKARFCQNYRCYGHFWKCQDENIRSNSKTFMIVSNGVKKGRFSFG